MATVDYRKFAPVLAKRTATWMSVAITLTFAAIMIFVPRVSDLTYIHLTSVVLFGVAGVWFMYRQATVSVKVSPAGLVVRNLIYTRELQWTEVVSVHFGDGSPWARLDLADTETLAVMGIQRADGTYARDEAQRLANLVALHSRVENDN